MINFIILTKTSNSQLFNITNELIDSLINTQYPNSGEFSKYRIILVQSDKTNKFKYTLHENMYLVSFSDEKFNYNKALNQGIKYCFENFEQNDWFCFMNNDIICDKNWIKAISNEYNKNKNIKSFCPNTGKILQDVQFGYCLHKHIIGYCFLTHVDVIKSLNLFDENFDFFYQDDDYSQQLRLNNILHACVKASNIIHKQSVTINSQLNTKVDASDLTNPNPITQKLILDSQKFIKKYSKEIFISREIQKIKIMKQFNVKK